MELSDVRSKVIPVRLDSITETVNFLVDRDEQTLIGPEPRSDIEVAKKALELFVPVTD